MKRTDLTTSFQTGKKQHEGSLHLQTGDSTKGTSQRWYSMPLLVLRGENTCSSFVSHVDVVSIQFAGLLGYHDAPHEMVDHGGSTKRKGLWSLNPLCLCRLDQIHYKSCIPSTNTLVPFPLSAKRAGTWFQMRDQISLEKWHFSKHIDAFCKAENTQKMGQRPRNLQNKIYPGDFECHEGRVDRLYWLVTEVCRSLWWMCTIMTEACKCKTQHTRCPGCKRRFFLGSYECWMLTSCPQYAIRFTSQVSSEKEQKRHPPGGPAFSCWNLSPSGLLFQTCQTFS